MKILVYGFLIGAFVGLLFWLFRIPEPTIITPTTPNITKEKYIEPNPREPFIQEDIDEFKG